jgi:hypothetical protein
MRPASFAGFVPVFLWAKKCGVAMGLFFVLAISDLVARDKTPVSPAGTSEPAIA